MSVLSGPQTGMFVPVWGPVMYRYIASGSESVLQKVLSVAATATRQFLRRTIFHSLVFIASIAEILVAFTAGRKPDTIPTSIAKAAPNRGSQSGMTDTAAAVPP